MSGNDTTKKNWNESVQELLKNAKAILSSLPQNEFFEQDFIMAIENFSGYTAGSVYQVLGKSQDETLGQCYLIKNKSNDKVDIYPINFAEKRFLNVTLDVH